MASFKPSKHRVGEPKVRCTSFNCAKVYGRGAEMYRHKRRRHQNDIKCHIAGCNVTMKPAEMEAHKEAHSRQAVGAATLAPRFAVPSAGYLESLRDDQAIQESFSSGSSASNHIPHHRPIYNTEQHPETCTQTFSEPSLLEWTTTQSQYSLPPTLWPSVPTIPSQSLPESQVSNFNCTLEDVQRQHRLQNQTRPEFIEEVQRVSTPRSQPQSYTQYLFGDPGEDWDPSEFDFAATQQG